MDPQAWVDRIRSICANGDWESLSQLRLETNQSFAEQADDAGLREFYQQVAELALDAKEREAIGPTDVEQFCADLRNSFCAAKNKVDNDEIKGIYLEYFYDGGDSCTANLFLCTEYSESDDSWGAEFEQDGFIEGPQVPTFFNFDPDFEWPDFSRYVAEEHANGVLLAAGIREWKTSGICGLPFGFANHDHEMIRVPATAV